MWTIRYTIATAILAVLLTAKVEANSPGDGQTTTLSSNSTESDVLSRKKELLAKSLVLEYNHNKTETPTNWTDVDSDSDEVVLPRSGPVLRTTSIASTATNLPQSSFRWTPINGTRRRITIGKVRVVGGRRPNEGNVEVFYMGRWGSVCDDEWDMREANVTCRQLGYQRALKFTHNSQFGLSRKRIWMDNMYCFGDEANLTSCRFEGWGNHDCTSQEAAGVVCDDPERSIITTANSTTTPLPLPPTFATNTSTTDNVETLLPLVNGKTTSVETRKKKSRIRHALPGPIQLRIVGGRVREEGRVEVRIGNGPWGVICGDGWGIFEAQITCKSLGLGHAQAAVQSSFFGGHHLPVVLSGVTCTGRENSLADCDHDQSGTVFCPGRTENIAGVICTELLPDLVPDHFELERSAYLEDRQLFFLQCAMEENCLAKSAYKYDPAVYGWQLEVRRLLRFTARISNVGNADFRPFIPKELWQWHMCHMHYHSMEVFAHFDVLDGSGKKVAEGHKASFCLEDNFCSNGIQPRYVCANYGDQGISVGCTDVYLHTVDCQWIDVTDVTPGVYFLKVSINPELKVPEMTYDNNAAICNMFYNSFQIHIWNCTITRP
ncbi:Lysyl oxidase 3 [Chamberlinius hualienensis]